MSARKQNGAGIGLATAGMFLSYLAQAGDAPYFTFSQAASGELAYGQSCERCHGADLQGGEFAPPLLGSGFVSHWAGQSLGSLFSRMKTTMPPGDAGTLSDQSYIAIIAYILETYGVQASTAALPAHLEDLDSLKLPPEDVLEPYTRAGGNALVENVKLPAWPKRANPLERITAVGDDLLDNPPDSSWLTWRRARDSSGFSPLRKISKRNIRELTVAWTFALPPGPNECTPLVHDGVLFAYSYGDYVQAIDAATGDELWHYHRELPRGAPTLVHRNIALYDDKLYFVTSDAHVIALRSKTGKLVWDQLVGDPSRRIGMATGGPLVVNGVVMQGLNASAAPGGGYVIGLESTTGRVLWKFNTIAQPGEPNGDSWNDLPREKRTGGSVWTAGSYDSRSGLAYFGPAPTYDTELLRTRVDKPGISNDALYTNSTVALDPLSGRLIWHYEHLPNDQWDLDWAFERQILDLLVAGKPRRLVVTAGKEAIYDVIDAQTGEYLTSFDVGLQNIVSSIDAKTGAKTIEQDRIPGPGKTVTVCPHAAGAKSWLPGSYDQSQRVLYVPLVESCMDISPDRRGQIGNVKLRPRPDSDGRYGRLQAISLETRKTLWTARQRAPQTTGVLATAGGVVFAGALDRWFTAYAADTGSKLWRVRLSDVPNAAPISYLVDGKQYVAVVVGAGFGQTETFLPLVPEIRELPTRSSALWVFALRE